MGLDAAHDRLGVAVSVGAALAVAWAAAVLDGARRFAAGPGLPPERYRALVGAAGAGASAPTPLERVGVRRLGDAVIGRVALLRPVGPDLVGVGIVAAVAGTVVFGIGGLLVALGGVAAAARRAVRRRVTAERTESRELAALIEVVALMVRSGLPLGVAIERACAAVAGSAPDALGRVLRSGPGTDVALQRWGSTGTAERVAIAALLSAALRSGGAVAERLEARAQRMRHRRRHELLAEARRLPVRLLVPLVCCTLPSFVALTVVPLLVVSLRSLGPLI